MDFGNGGYVIVDLSKGKPITVSPGAPTTIPVSREDAAKLKQWDKPVMFAPLILTTNGVTINRFTGFSQHIGAVNGWHICGLWTIEVADDTHVTISYTE